MDKNYIRKLIDNQNDVLNSKEFKESYGTMIEDIKTETETVFYYSIFLLRRILYSAIVILLIDYPLIQIGLILSLICLPVKLILSLGNLLLY